MMRHSQDKKHQHTHSFFLFLYSKKCITLTIKYYIVSEEYCKKEVIFYVLLRIMLTFENKYRTCTMHTSFFANQYIFIFIRHLINIYLSVEKSTHISHFSFLSICVCHVHGMY
jgi:hypothetical protein